MCEETTNCPLSLILAHKRVAVAYLKSGLFCRDHHCAIITKRGRIRHLSRKGSRIKHNLMRLKIKADTWAKDCGVSVLSNKNFELPFERALLKFSSGPLVGKTMWRELTIKRRYTLCMYVGQTLSQFTSNGVCGIVGASRPAQSDPSFGSD